MADPSTQSHELPQEATGSAALSTTSNPNHSPDVPSFSPSSVSLSYPQKSGATHVDLDFFDPEGVRNLERTLSQLTEAHVGAKEKRESVSSGGTLITDGPFDFEKALRGMVQK
jgi:ATP-binding cassette, subfamily G (WHITE), member 2, SNQ2